MRTQFRSGAAFRRANKSAWLTSAGLFALALPVAASAQTTGAPVAPAGSADPLTAASKANENASRGAQVGDSADIIVTARREAENLQNVPVSVQVVTGDTIQKLAITQASEIAKLTPGLTLRLPDPTSPSIVLRGIRWVQASGTPAIPVYFNEISFDPVQTVQTLYDVGQIEVLRGPQGTARGAPSISGAITITTKRPDLDQYGGYVSGQLGTHGHSNLQGAINIPVIKDKLAIRVAGDFEDSQGNGVRSINSATKPYIHNRSGRISVRFEPTDNFSINGMFQRLDQKAEQFFQVTGTGTNGNADYGLGFAGPGLVFPDPFAPAGYNIAPRTSISANDYLAVGELPNLIRNKTDLITLNAAWNIFGQTLSYNFGSQINHVTPNNGFALDPYNLLVGYDEIQQTTSPRTPSHTFHEVRLSSIRGGHHLLDYDVGFYRERQKSEITFDTVGAFLPGAFGNPLTGLPPSPFVNPTIVNRYALRAHTDIKLDTDNYSFYGNVQLHLPYDTELTGGVRWIHDRRPSTVATTLGNEYVVASPNFGFPCAFLPSPVPLVDSPNYPGYCEVFLTAGGQPPIPVSNLAKTYKPVIFNASISHKFSDAVLAYATVGSSWRAGLPAIANQGLPSNYVFPKPEKATSYELGIKTSPTRGVRFNADIFQIDYKGQLTQFGGIQYFDVASGIPRSTTQSFLYNLDARVRGVEAELFLRPMRNLSLTVDASYSKITSKGGLAPANPGDCATAVAVGAGNLLNLCPIAKGANLNASSPFQASVSGSYTVPFGPAEGYVRFVANHQGSNPAYGISTDSFTAKAYNIVDLFAGVTGNRGGWDIGAYAKNVFNEKVVLTRSVADTGSFIAFGPTGLDQVTMTARRELGLQARFSFGSR